MRRKFQTTDAFPEPNYTQTPNDFFDMLPEMESSEVRVTLVMIRETFGYHRESFKMGIGKLAEAAGLSRGAAKDGAEAAEKRGTFRRINPDSQTEAEWELVVGQSMEGVNQWRGGGQPVEGGRSMVDPQVGVKEKKEIKETANAVSPLEKESWYQFEKAAQTGETWEGRETIPPHHLPLADWYHKVTGQTCQKRVQKGWMRALTDWYSSGLTVADLQAAYDVDIKWRGVFTSPMELTAKAIALKAQGGRKTDEKRPEYKPYVAEEIKAVPNPLRKPRL